MRFFRDTPSPAPPHPHPPTLLVGKAFLKKSLVLCAVCGRQCAGCGSDFSVCVYIVFPCVKHFTYHVCCESPETATVRRRREGLPEDPTETEAPPLRMERSRG